MAKFYELRDDLYLPQRWHLDDPVNDEGCNRADFTAGAVANVSSTPTITVVRAGTALDFTLTAIDVPVASRPLAEVFSRVAGRAVQRIPVRIGVRENYDIINATFLVRCLDERRSEFLKWTESDHRSDLAGQYRMVTKLHIDSTLVPQGTHIFRVAGWAVALIVSRELMEAMKVIGAVGAKYTPVD